jgi:NAD(P)-dependent dehydrogenase (short-subunit alcohol dehydrogenase family)
MKGRVCVVTGATGGIGFETALGIARQGATVVVVGRSAEKCGATVEQIARQTGNPNVESARADLSIQGDIRRLADELITRYPRIHVLVNNVGAVFMKRQQTADGIEMTLALNHLGPYLLTRLLLPVLTSSVPARIVNVSSFAHLTARLNFPSLDFSGWNGYTRSKLANIAFTYELARRLTGSGVTANVLSPGLVASNFGMNNPGPFRLMKPLINLFAVSNETGAQTSVFLACSADVERISGQYFTRCKARRSSGASTDRAAAARLWEVSAGMTGLSVD